MPCDNVGRQPGHHVPTFADPIHAREPLGWTTRHHFDEMVESAYRWHRIQVATG